MIIVQFKQVAVNMKLPSKIAWILFIMFPSLLKKEAIKMSKNVIWLILDISV